MAVERKERSNWIYIINRGFSTTYETIPCEYIYKYLVANYGDEVVIDNIELEKIRENINKKHTKNYQLSTVRLSVLRLRKIGALKTKSLNIERTSKIPKNITKKQYNKGLYIKKMFNIEMEYYEKLKIEQNDLCAICLTKGKRELSIDHDHNTGLVRGLLCTNCNMALGHFKDDIKLLKRAIDYINKSRDIHIEC